MLREMCGICVHGEGEVHLKVTGRSSYLRGYNWWYGDETTTARIVLVLMWTHYGFSSKNWYLLLVSVRAWFSSKISDDYPRTPITFMWEYSTPPFSGLRITHDTFPVHGVYCTSYCSIFLRCAALFPSYKKVMLENFLRDRHKKINLYRPMQWKQPGSADLYTPIQPSFTTHV